MIDILKAIYTYSRMKRNVVLKAFHIPTSLDEFLKLAAFSLRQTQTQLVVAALEKHAIELAQRDSNLFKALESHVETEALLTKHENETRAKRQEEARKRNLKDRTVKTAKHFEGDEMTMTPPYVPLALCKLPLRTHIIEVKDTNEITCRDCWEALSARQRQLALVRKD